MNRRNTARPGNIKLSRLLRFLALVVGSVLFMSTLSACSGPAASTLTVPALWADQTGGTSGMEYATVSTVPSDVPGFTVDLEKTASKGGGASWLAASASAAVVGILYTGTNPSHIDISFDITDAIDGPSAGGILAVGVLASINHTSLKPHITMTGTLSPDGTIGPVGAVGLKMDAALENGFTTVVVPEDIQYVIDTSTEEMVPTTEYAQKLGLDVKFVTHVTQAYEIFTDEPLMKADKTVPSASPSASELEAEEQVAREIVAEAAELLTQVYVKPNSNLTRLINAAQDALEQKDFSLAYGLGAELLLRTARLQGQQITAQEVSETGLEAAVANLIVKIDAELAHTSDLTTSVLSDLSDFSASEQFALPLVLSNEVYAHSVLRSMKDQLQALDPTDPFSGETLTVASGVVFEQIANMESLSLYEMKVIRSLPADSVSFTTEPAEYLSGYTDFLVHAGNANVSYLEDVFGTSISDFEMEGINSNLPTIELLKKDVSEISSEIQKPEVELTQFATAMTYFVVSSAGVAGYQTLGAAAVNYVSTEVEEEHAYLSDAVAESNSVNQSFADLIEQAGLQPGFALWSAGWATSMFTVLKENDHESEGATLALNQLWYDLVNVMALHSYSLSPTAPAK